MAKISMLCCFFLFVLISMPASSSSSRMKLKDEVEERCPKVAPSCAAVLCPIPTEVCPQLMCIKGFVLYQPCCECQRCCPAA
ncbi:hypothetical protein MKW94_013866 [Papaver nudicaule]|uniref:Uncharacterized protein n=1 Tax=Papaver nudicaule TaxID=74823 RepID=A0AA41RU98_PAPNU|nr:hypothetical protein [Papaver nudicaule]